MLTPLEFFYAFQISIVGVTVGVLMAQGEVLEWWLDVLTWMKSIKLEWLAKPFGLCEKCLSGQLAFWFFMYLYWNLYEFMPVQTAYRHIIFTSCAILGAHTLKSILKKWSI